MQLSISCDVLGTEVQSERTGMRDDVSLVIVGKGDLRVFAEAPVPASIRDSRSRSAVGVAVISENVRFILCRRGSRLDSIDCGGGSILAAGSGDGVSTCLSNRHGKLVAVLRKGCAVADGVGNTTGQLPAGISIRSGIDGERAAAGHDGGVERDGSERR